MLEDHLLSIFLSLYFGAGFLLPAMTLIAGSPKNP